MSTTVILFTVIETDFPFFNPDSNGDVYEGDWVNDLRQGHGIMKFVDGTIYGVSQVAYSCIHNKGSENNQLRPMSQFRSLFCFSSD